MMPCWINAVGELVKFLDSHDDTGIAASIILNLENPDTIQNFGQTIDFQSFSTEPLYVNEYFTNELPEVNFSDAVPACSLMIRKSITDKIGFLPKDFYLYWDDTEWCTRVRELGYKVASVKASQALHAMGAREKTFRLFRLIMPGETGFIILFCILKRNGCLNLALLSYNLFIRFSVKAMKVTDSTVL